MTNRLQYRELPNLPGTGNSDVVQRGVRPSLEQLQLPHEWLAALLLVGTKNGGLRRDNGGGIKVEKGADK